jgi:hypothetical protein
MLELDKQERRRLTFGVSSCGPSIPAVAVVRCSYARDSRQVGAIAEAQHDELKKLGALTKADRSPRNL